MQEETDKPTITVRDFNTTLSIISRTSGQKISKDVDNLGNALHQLSLIDVYRSHHPTTAEYTFLVSAHEDLPRCIILRSIKQVSTHLKRFKSYKVCSLTMGEVNHKSVTDIWKISK